MTTNFRYVPLAPEPISGPSFISQTEAAVNELGTAVDEATATANSAYSLAQMALSTANDALETAQHAITVGTRAQEAADAAQLTADEGLALAGQALKEARQAQATADQAVKAAQIAQSTADLAQSAADGGMSVALEARSLAARAVEVASEAVEVAMAAVAGYAALETDRVEEDGQILVLEEIDADERFTEQEKLYVTGGAIRNFPVAAGPFYLEVLTSTDGTSCTQRIWTQDNQSAWSRTASIALPAEDEDGAKPVASWTDWSFTGTRLMREAWETTHKPVFFGLTLNADRELVIHMAGDGETVRVSDYGYWSILPRGSSYRYDKNTGELSLTLP